MRVPAIHSGVVLLLLIASAGCTTTDEVVESWRGYPIDDVFAQWGPPSSSYDDHSPGGSSYTTVHPVREGQRVFRWQETTTSYYAAHWETRYRQVNGQTVCETRYVPARTSTRREYFLLSTDDQGRVVHGRSGRSGLLMLLDGRYAASDGRWGTVRRE